MSVTAKRYTSVSKGGEYEMIGASSGAGQRKGDVVLVYRNTVTGQIHHREPEDFAMRMKPAKPDVSAQLLAALLAFRESVPDNRHAKTAEVDPYHIEPEVLAQIDTAIAAAKGEV